MVDLSYKGKEILNINEPDIEEGNILQICFYAINDMPNPFLEFLFFNENDNLNFLKFKYNGNIPSKEGYNIIKNIFFEFDETIKYTGYIDNILFYEMVTNIENVSYKKKKDKMWFLLVDEIINKKYSLHMNVDNEVVSFFLKNSSLLFLIDDKNRILPSPIACYFGHYLSYIKAISVFGVQKASLYASQGPFYYFSNYHEALKMSIWSQKSTAYSINNKPIAGKNGKYTVGGLIRFAIFLDKTKLITHNMESEKKKQETKIENINNNYNVIYYKSSRRISSRNRDEERGTTTYNKGNNINYSIREYSKQYPISYFSVNTDNIKSIDDMYKIKIE